MRIIIIEDEPLLAQKLKTEILKVHPATEVLAMLRSIAEAIGYFADGEQPDLIFSDIQLPDGLSFEIFKRVETAAPVIFCTAYDDYALEAFRSNGIDYILKPFSDQDIKKTLNKYHSLTQQSEPNQDLYASLGEMIRELKAEPKKSLLVYRKDKIIPLKVADIALALTENGNTSVLTFEGTRWTVNHNLDALHQKLGSSFYRLNRQYLIQRDAVEKVSQYFARKLLIHPTVDFSEPLIVSKANASNFLNWLESI